jgi:hypothetical protein
VSNSLANAQYAIALSNIAKALAQLKAGQQPEVTDKSPKLNEGLLGGGAAFFKAKEKKKKKKKKSPKSQKNKEARTPSEGRKVLGTISSGPPKGKSRKGNDR